MRFAIAAADVHLGVFQAFVEAGWKPLKLFTYPAVADWIGAQQAVTDYALRNKAAIQASRMTKADMRHLHDIGCEVLVVACYDWKIPDWRENLKYAVNFHPSPLPDARGHYPPFRAILEGWTYWGVTCHRLSQEFDKGDILASEHFPLGPDECHERLNLKIQMAARKLATRAAREFVQLWEQAEPQAGGSYWPKIPPRDRVIDFQQPVAAILRHIRAFGTTGSLVSAGDNWMVVPRAVGWTEEHNHAPGTAVHTYAVNRAIVMAAQDGYVGLLNTYVAPAYVTAGL